ncbi:hypothetical protein AJ79_06105 [Helicocarpus griseus UAMH5409]|uniref:Uncharacterized protein n=1 Tax=Helicocarpus griseus UAMH5409 TaxID=1447875 RepID=A0A2B7XGQ2_9EURO|nr:hypothetical protein AJ79_06105 [Helicocarpus griseus UAMH5409]
MALVEFESDIPQFLAKLIDEPLVDWQVKIMNNVAVTFDRHFHRFTQLSPESTRVIAITGLDGHAYGSWKGRGNAGSMWLRDFLSQDLPHCRTMIYGYNSKLSSHGVDTLEDYYRGFMEQINQVRDASGLEQRPLFLIAHSFGGIILARCIINSCGASANDLKTTATSFFRSTYGILFFAIPHKGLVIDDIRKMLPKDDNRSPRNLDYQLDSRSRLLSSQLFEFRNAIRDRKIVSYYEEKKTPRLVRNKKSKTSGRTGKGEIAVDANSAILHLPDHMEPKIPIERDHSNIVKFDSKSDSGYSSAIGYLKQFERDAPPVVSNRFNRQLAQSSPTSRPPFTVPFKRNADFVGRRDILERIESILSKMPSSPEHNRAALSGLGGIGKSQIAIEYAYRCRKRSPQICIFWVHAGDAANFEQGYKRIANEVKPMGWDESEADILQLVSDWLSNETDRRWIMILDNADLESILFDAAGQTRDKAARPSSKTARFLSNFLPQTLNGSILITSRSRIVASRLAGGDAEVIDISRMNESDTLTLFRRKLKADVDDDIAAELLEELDYIPLAVTRAAAFIKERSPRVTVSQFLYDLLKTESLKTRLLRRNGEDDLRDDTDLKYITSIWQTSFENIRKLSTRLLGCSKLPSGSIFDLFRPPKDLPDDVIFDEDWNIYPGTDNIEAGFEDDVHTLKDHSLITVVDGTSFEMYRLVQFAVKNWLEMNGDFEFWKERYITVMHDEYPPGNIQDWAICQRLFPHAEVILAHRPLNDSYLKQWADILTDAAEHARAKGNHYLAVKISRQALEGYEKAPGSWSHEMVITTVILTESLVSEGQPDEAEELCRKALALRGEFSGQEHLAKGRLLIALGQVYIAQKRLQTAEEVVLQGIDMIGGGLSPGCLEKVIPTECLASVYIAQGHLGMAEGLLLNVLEEAKRELGEEHPATLCTMQNLGAIYEKQGQWNEAEEMLTKTLEMRRAVLGRDHFSTLRSMMALASVHSKQKLWVLAEPLHEEVIEWDEAQKLHTKVFKLRKMVLGEEHPKTLNSMEMIALMLKAEGCKDEALQLMTSCVEMSIRSLGEDDPDVKWLKKQLDRWRRE